MTTNEKLTGLGLGKLKDTLEHSGPLIKSLSDCMCIFEPICIVDPVWITENTK